MLYTMPIYMGLPMVPVHYSMFNLVPLSPIMPVPLGNMGGTTLSRNKGLCSDFGTESAHSEECAFVNLMTTHLVILWAVSCLPNTLSKPFNMGLPTGFIMLALLVPIMLVLLVYIVYMSLSLFDMAYFAILGSSTVYILLVPILLVLLLDVDVSMGPYYVT